MKLAILTRSSIDGRYRVSCRAEGDMRTILDGQSDSEAKPEDDAVLFDTLEESVSFIQGKAKESGEPHKILAGLSTKDSDRFHALMSSMRAGLSEKEEVAA